jgi:hypothetical protein
MSGTDRPIDMSGVLAGPSLTGALARHGRPVPRDRR